MSGRRLPFAQMPTTVRPQRRAYRVRIAIAAIVLGAVTTVAVAWVGAYFETAFSGNSITQSLVFDDFAASYFMDEGWIITRVGIDWRPYQRGSSTILFGIDARTGRRQAKVPAWSHAWLTERPKRPPGTWSNRGGESTLHEFAAGWPCRAVWSDCDEASHEPKTFAITFPSSRGGITLPFHNLSIGKISVVLPRSLPYRPLMLGFAADTALFGLLWALVLLVPAARRGYRDKRNRCVSCGYDRRGLPSDETPCPECAAMKPMRSVATQVR